MMKFFSRHIIYILIAASLFSCKEVNELELELKKQGRTASDVTFSNQFIETYGNISSATSWIMAEKKTVSIDLSDAAGGSYKVSVCTTDPRYIRDDCYRLAEKKNVSGAIELSYDCPLGLDHVYISAIDNNGNGLLVRIPVEETTASFNNAIKFTDSGQDIPIMTYVIGYETYKDGADFDYNDIVLGVRYLTGESSAEIAILAVGCSLPAKVSYQRISNQKSKLETVFEEAHDAIGFPPYYDMSKDRYIYDVFNTGWNSTDNIPTATIDLSSFETSIIDFAPNLRVLFNPEEDEPQTAYVPADKGSKFPEAICMSNPDWYWPSEGVEIGTEFPVFAKYVGNPTSNLHWGGGLWAKANALENSNISENNPFGRVLKLENGLISSNQIKDLASYPCQMVFKVSNVQKNSTLKLCKYPNTTILFNRTLDITYNGYYYLDLSALDMNNIVDEQTFGQASGLQFDYEGFNIDEVYIR